MPSIDFNPRSRWPFSAFFSSSIVPVPTPSPPPRCSCNFLGGDFEETHSHGQSFWHQCHPRAAEFVPPSPQLSQSTPLSANTKLNITDDTQESTPSTSDNKAGIPVSDIQKTDYLSGKTRSSEYLGSGFFNKDEATSRSSTPPAAQSIPNGNGNATQAATHGCPIVEGNTMPATKFPNPVTPPNKASTWRARAASKTSSGETNGNSMWLHRSTRPIDKPWRRDSAPTAGYSSLQSRSAGDRSGYIPSTKDNVSSVPSMSSILIEPERKTVLGCSQCLSDPKLRVSPCGCLICLNCGGRYWGAGQSGSGVYCGCGEVSSTYVSGVVLKLTSLRPSPA